MEEKLDELKREGIRLTPQRVAVMEYLSNTTSHPTADTVHQAIESNFPNLSLATVYNNLHFLTDKGVIKELHYGNGSSRFDFNTVDHYHIVCELCEKVEDFNYPMFYEVEKFAEAFYEYHINTHRLELYGVCKECQSQNLKPNKDGLKDLIR